ncbi:DUF3848 domain-containing protein [Ruminococcaceae bacterium OttesenSCG-928-D13]|nr:DUF3848 domain-containing protein [Ruminococcaceae bacterium OttesenSCG-928-D13]
MNKNEIMDQLREKLDRNLDAYENDWWRTSPSVLVGKAKEIAATQTVYNELHDGDYSTDFMEYLLRFENPLEVVRDQWIQHNALPLDEDMTRVLWHIMDTGDAERDYELDKEYKPPSMDQGVTMC